MKIGIISGSGRHNSESRRISKYISELISREHQQCGADIFDLSELNPPLWSEDKWKPDSELAQWWLPVARDVSACSGFVVVTPEWAGMVPPHLKNFLLSCDKGEVAHKPALIVSVSSGLGGAYPVAELRMSGYKNNQIWWLPDHIILRNVKTLFCGENSDLDSPLEKRILYCLRFLVGAAEHLAPVREENQNLSLYKYGM